MSLVIVTKNQYLIASRIHHITLDETTDYIEVRSPRGRMMSVRQDNYIIHIIYTPETTNSNNNREDVRECNVTLRGKIDAYRLYKDLIRQIREQMPDALFLDKAFESLLTEAELTTMASEEQELLNDRGPKKIRPARKAKRRNQKVLRKSKKRH